MVLGIWRGLCGMAVRMAQLGCSRCTRLLIVGGLLLAGPVLAADRATSPDVEVNWGLLENLGQESTLPQLLLRDSGQSDSGGSGSVQYRPYRPDGGRDEPAAVKPKEAKPAAEIGGNGPTFRPYQPKAPQPKVTSPQVLEPASLPEAVKPQPKLKPKPEPVVVAPPQVPAVVESVEAETPPVVPPKAPSPVVPRLPPKEKMDVAPPAAIPPVAQPPVTMPKVDVPKVVEPSEPVAAPPPALIEVPKAEVPHTVMPEVISPKAEIPKEKPSIAPNAAAWVEGNTLILRFNPDEAVILEEGKTLLNELATRLAQDESLSLQFLAYAGGNESQVSKARRLSLTRALTVRQFFLDHGVRSTRMEVRAMGNRGADGRQPEDRVEIIVVSR